MAKTLADVNSQNPGQRNSTPCAFNTAFPRWMDDVCIGPGSLSFGTSVSTSIVGK